MARAQVDSARSAAGSCATTSRRRSILGRESRGRKAGAEKLFFFSASCPPPVFFSALFALTRQPPPSFLCKLIRPNWRVLPRLDVSGRTHRAGRLGPSRAPSISISSSSTRTHSEVVRVRISGSSNGRPEPGASYHEELKETGPRSTIRGCKSGRRDEERRSSEGDEE